MNNVLYSHVDATHLSTLSEGVLYTRYSSHSQRDVSIEQQVKACKQFAERNGIKIVHIYEDHAMTGTNDKRPGFQQMIQDAKTSQWSYVIVYSLDRFARDRYDSAVYKRHLKEAGVKILSATENITDDPAGVLMESLLEGLAEYYSKELSRKIRRGLGDNAAKCMVNGTLPLGYVRGADGRYAIDEAEAVIVQEIFRRVSECESFTAIIQDLNNRCIPTKVGKPWNKSSFNRLLSNERYIGTYIYGDMRIPGGIPPIVDKSVFEAVQLRLGSKANPRTNAAPRRRRRENGVYLLTGKLFCGKCKSPMVGISGKNRHGNPFFYYTCKAKRTYHTCDKQNVRREVIEQTVATALRNTLLTPEAVSALADAAIAYQNAQAPSTELAALQARHSETKRSIANLLTAIESGIFTPATRDRLLELEAQERALSAQLVIARETAEDLLTREEIIAALELFQYGDVNDKDYQEALIDTFLVAAYVYDDKIRFVFNLGNKQKDTTIPFNIDDVDLSNDCISSASVHQRITVILIHGCGYFLFVV